MQESQRNKNQKQYCLNFVLFSYPLSASLLPCRSHRNRHYPIIPLFHHSIIKKNQRW